MSAKKNSTIPLTQIKKDFRLKYEPGDVLITTNWDMEISPTFCVILCHISWWHKIIMMLTGDRYRVLSIDSDCHKVKYITAEDLIFIKTLKYKTTWDDIIPGRQIPATKKQIEEFVFALRLETIDIPFEFKYP